jgi:hypothetical protein
VTVQSIVNGDGIGVTSISDDWTVDASPFLVREAELAALSLLAANIPGSGLRCWVDAASPYKVVESGVCTRLKDRSGNGFDFTAGGSAPVCGASNGASINGLDALFCNGTTGSMGAGAADFLHQGPSTLCAVVRSDSGATDPQGPLVSTTTEGGAGDTGYVVYLRTGGNSFLRLEVKNGSGVDVPVAFSTALALDAPCVISVVSDPTNATFADRGFLYIDGVDSGASNAEEGDVSNGPANLALQMGTDGWPMHFFGMIGEVLIYDRLLDAGELDDVNDYLSAKWGV